MTTGKSLKPEAEASRTEVKPCLGFRFTEREEKMMGKAAREAKKFMRHYGKGRKPYMVDISHYKYINPEGKWKETLK